MNQLKTTILLGFMTGLVLLIGYEIGGQSGVFIALILSAVMNFASYFWSDKIVLATYGAQPADEYTYPQLYSTVRELCTKANLPMPRIYIVATDLPNAFATGRNPEHAVVAVTSGLMTNLSNEEVRGVLAHELSHIKNSDMLVSSVAATLAGAISYLAQLAYFAGAFGGSSEDNRRGGGLSGLIMLILSPIIAMMLSLAISRSREYLADESGAKLAGSSAGLVNALKKLDSIAKNHPVQGTPRETSAAHLFIVNPFKPSLLTSLFSTHPPIEERIARLNRMS